MTKEDLTILYKDLCARLPYKPTVHIEHDVFYDEREPYDTELNLSVLYNRCAGMEIKPYLRPLSSMTDEEKEELKQEFCIDVREEDNGRHTEEYGYVTVYHNFNNETWYIPYEAIDWLNEHHFDYRGLIEKGLAIEISRE